MTYTKQLHNNVFNMCALTLNIINKAMDGECVIHCSKKRMINYLCLVSWKKL